MLHQDSSRAESMTFPLRYSAFIFAVFLVVGCKQKTASLETPSFPKAVIEAGRGAVTPAEAGASSWLGAPVAAGQETQPPPPPPPVAIPATKAAIEEAIKRNAYGETAEERSSAIQSLAALGPEAVDPLIEILEADVLPDDLIHSAVRLLIRLGREDRAADSIWDLPAVPADRRVLTPDANRIVDAVVAYAAKHPDSIVPVADLASILPLNRLGEVIEWADVASRYRQSGYISIFSTLTHTTYPVIPSGFCGSSSPASIHESIRKGEERQRSSPQLMRAWWAEHGKQPYSDWVLDAIFLDIESVRARSDPMHATYENDPQRLAMVLQHSPSGDMAVIGAYAFDPLCKKFAESPAWLQPLVLGQIGRCDHPGRLEFVSRFLKSPSDNVRYVVVDTLGKLGASSYAPEIRRILEETTNPREQELAIKTLSAFSDSASIESIARHLASTDYLVADEAESAIRSFLAEQDEGVARVAKTHANAEVRRALSEILLQWDATQAVEAVHEGRSTPEDCLPSVARLLESSDAASRRTGIWLVDQNDLVELIPKCLVLLEDPDPQTRHDAIELMLAKGIPGLSTEHAGSLLGRSLRLDRQIAAYCYSRFGDEALPIVRKVAFQWRDPAKPANYPAGSPPMDLFKILRDTNEPDLDNRTLQLVREVMESRSCAYLPLIDILSPPASRDLIDELLTKEPSHVMFAIQWIRDHGETAYADRLAELALTADPVGASATEALIEFGDERAWPAAVRLLESDVLDSSKHSMGIPGPSAAYGIGVKLQKLRASHRSQMHAMLAAEMEGGMRIWIVVALTAALAHDPEAPEQDLLKSIARNEGAPRAAQILAAVALSHLGDRAALPELRRLVRDCLRLGYSSSYGTCVEGEFLYSRSSVFDRFRNNVLSKDHDWIDRASAFHGLFGRRIVESVMEDSSIIDALHGLDDDSLDAEIADALISSRGEWNQNAYGMLLRCRGMEGYRLAQERLGAHDPIRAAYLTRTPELLLGVKMTRDEALEVLTYNKFRLRDEGVLIVQHRLHEAADPLVKLFGKCDDRYAPYRATILDLLCRLGDRRGLDLAVDDPLLFLQVGKYLDAPSVPVIDEWGFKFNRIQDALALIDWYRDHREGMIWDDAIRKFRSSSAPRAG
ncbi:MAG: HEAT repeat domain-containing protein [Phycisphaerales bacterium]|nr:HEAT repeat domain-containing protein [Phycisphaerales bacterium]